MVQRVVLIGVAGAFGALARYGMSHMATTWFGFDKHWGTTVVNVTGCLLFGLVVGLLRRHFPVSPELQLIVLTGFMGAFTTFSTYMFETHELIDQGYWHHAVANLAVQNVLGLIAMIGGLALSRVQF